MKNDKTLIPFKLLDSKKDSMNFKDLKYSTELKDLKYSTHHKHSTDHKDIKHSTDHKYSTELKETKAPKIKPQPISLDSLAPLEEVILGKRKNVTNNLYIFNNKSIMS